MNSIKKQERRYVETYNYKNDFSILTKKEKRRILKNAQHLLKLQQEDAITPSDTGSGEEKAVVV